MQENTRLRTIYSVPYAEKSMPMTKDELDNDSSARALSLARQRAGVSSMGWGLTRRCASRLPVRAVVIRG